MRAALLALICAVLLCGSALGVGVAVAEDAPAEPTLVYEIDVDADGDATWEVSAQFPIESEDDAEAFEELAELYQEDDGEEFLPVAPYERAVDRLDDEFDRSMSIGSEERSVEQREEVGILSLTFVWEGFAEVDDNRVQVGDVFDVDDQTWFTRLESHERLAMHAPDGYTVESSGLPVQDGTMTASGPRNLAPSDLQGTFVGPEGGSPISPLLGGALGLIGLAIVVFVLLHLLGWDLVQYVPGDQDTDSADAAPVDAHDDEDSEGDDVLEDEELLGDEERVLALIERNGGRMKQAQIVNETDWSNAKVSQLLSQMAEDGDVEKLRIGRENLIRLPDEDE